MLFLCMSALSCMSALWLYFLLHWNLLSSGQIPSCVCKHTCNKALLILIIVFFLKIQSCCHHVPQYMAFCWLTPRLHSIQCQMIVCDYKKTTHTTEVSRNTSKHTHTHTHTHTKTGHKWPGTHQNTNTYLNIYCKICIRYINMYNIYKYNYII